MVSQKAALVARIQEWGQALGFSQIGVASIDLSSAEPGLLAWLEAGFHGEMGYMAHARTEASAPGRIGARYGQRDYGAHGLSEP